MYQTQPRYLIISVMVAFLVSNVGLVLQVKKYIDSLKEDNNTKK